MDKPETLYPWGHTRRFNDYSAFIKKEYGGRVQKISVNVGFTCPNRDGSKGTGGCIYCNNSTFKPGYCEPGKSVPEQILKGVSFFETKYPDMRYMAYFQSYTNTYAPINELKELYLQAVTHPKVIGLIIGTRPDCISPQIVEMLVEINQSVPVTVEFGLESTLDKTLVEINRCHTWADSVNAIQLCHNAGLPVGAHLILGLPGEDVETLLTHADVISTLPIQTIKLHQLQVIKGTTLASRYAQNPHYVRLFSFQEYLDVAIQFLERLSPNIVVERFVSVSPTEKLIAPQWNKLKNFEVVAMLEKELEARNTWQGRLFKQ